VVEGSRASCDIKTVAPDDGVAKPRRSSAAERMRGKHGPEEELSNGAPHSKGQAIGPCLDEGGRLA
jgi:hypothetical protein